MQTLYLIDAMALAYRCFYANRRNLLKTSKGKEVTVPYYSAVFMHKLLEERHPDYLALVGDTADRTFRHELFPAYKENRSVMPDALEEQLPLLHELFVCLGIKQLQLSGYEADDIIGTLAKKYASPELQIYIVSQDKDFMQLLDKHTLMLDKDYQVVDPAAVFQRFQCKPTQIIDLLALMGDSADNVPGVPRVGEKTATKLLTKYGSLAGIYKELDSITPAGLQNNLRVGQESAVLSQKLVKISVDVPVKTRIEDFAYQQNPFNNERLYEFYRKLEFKRLLSKFSIGTDTNKSKSSLPLTVVTNDNIVLAQIKQLAQAKRLVLYLQANSDDQLTALPERLIVGNEQGLYAFIWQELEPSIRDKYLNFILHSDAMKIGCNLKPVFKCLWNAGLDLHGAYLDLMLYDYLLYPNNHNHTLASMTSRHLESELQLDDDIQHCQALLALVDMLEPKVIAAGMGRLAREMEMPLVRVLALMEQRGVYLNVGFMNSYSEQIALQLKMQQEKIHKLADCEFNINSPQQLQKVMYDKLRIHEQLGVKLKKTKTGYSTNESVLSKLDGHPLPATVIKYRELAKLKGTYVDALPRHVHPHSNRVHTNYQQDVAATGRLSSNNPNLQNIPIRNPFGQKIRAAFTPQHSDHVLISADYSQIEIRLLAELASAKSLIKAFNSDQDVHRITAAKVFKIPLEQVTDAQRLYAKAINFGIIYGMGARNLARTIKTTLQEAREFIDNYFRAYPEIKNFTNSLVDKADRLGFSETPFGRRREIIGIRDSSPVVYAHARNMAVNSCIQGYAADLIKLAMLKVEHALADEQLETKMIMQVHDELVFECPCAELPRAMQVIRTSMETAIKSKVKIKVDIGFGGDLLNAK